MPAKFEIYVLLIFMIIEMPNQVKATFVNIFYNCVHKCAKVNKMATSLKVFPVRY
jgi:hypothetical protein